MKATVFVDKIGNIFNGEMQSANEHYDKYKDLSMRGVGNFAGKDIYLLNERGDILKSHGNTIFRDGGLTEDGNDIIRDVVIGRKINNSKIANLGFMALQDSEGSILTYKSNNGEHPLIKKSNGHAIFFKKSFSPSDYINSMESSFIKYCIENAIKYHIQ